RQSVKSLALWYKSQPFIRHPNLILYHPRIHIPSMASAALPITIPPSGTLAGLFARLDETRGVWKAPAGMEATLMGVMGLEQLLTSQDVTLLESGNINALKQTSPTTFVAWGSRTLSPDPEWRYVPVRRTALFLESSIKQGLTWTVFEPNDEPLWKQIRQSVGDFLTSLFRQGAFQGTKPQDAFFVKCGRDTITANDQAAGLLHILVGFAPLKPAEFVTLRISQKVSPRP
ncbi:MAG: phage tail sheath family protein, partial [Nitrospira sp.]|nr:phage tail sheath family protein [Nitrospira sp.]